MKKNYLAACVQGDTLLYELYSFRGHVFRVYPDGKIGRADESDRRTAERAARWIK